MNWFDKSTFQYFLGVIAGLLVSAMAIYLGYLLISAPKISVSDYIQMLILVFISGTMFVSIWSQKKKDEREVSEDYLNRSTVLMNRAYEVLCSESACPNNNRISWVTAARLLQTADDLSKRISMASHKDIFLSEHDYQRHRFNELLSSNGESLPTEFFLGGSIVSGDLGKSAFNCELEKLGTDWIPTKIVSVIYRFKSYPINYNDPLKSATDLTTDELDSLWLLDSKGVCDYFTFRNNFVPVMSKIFQTFENENENSREVTESEINSAMASLSGVVPVNSSAT